MGSSPDRAGTAGRMIEFASEDGATIAAYLSTPSAGVGPGLLVLSSDSNNHPYINRFCDYLSEDGYVVLAPDLSARSGASDDGSIADVRAALLVLASHAEKDAGVGLIGFGRGGGLAFAAAADIGADVLVTYDAEFHEREIARVPRIACPMVHHLAKDHPRPGAAAIRAAATDRDRIQVFEYDDCAPGFALPSHPSFSRIVARVAYSRTLAPLRRELGPVYDLAGLLWEHLRYEFETKDADATMETMVDTPYVNHVPTMTGGVGHDELKRFYKYHFIPKQPKDRNMVLLSETVGADTVVLEFVSRFTHNDPFDHWLPGVPPTGKYCEVPVVVIAKFRGGKLYNEHIYWDSASVLAQLGLIDQDKLPVAGIQGTKKLLDETLPSNELMPNWHESEGKPL